MIVERTHAEVNTKIKRKKQKIKKKRTKIFSVLSLKV